MQILGIHFSFSVPYSLSLGIINSGSIIKSNQEEEGKEEERRFANFSFFMVIVSKWLVVKVSVRIWVFHLENVP